MTRRYRPALLTLWLLAISAGCTSGIPLFSPQARLVNRANSGLEAVAELNNYAAQLRDDGLITQAQLNAVSPQIDKAEALFRSARIIARAATTTQPATTQPTSQIEQAKAILTSVRSYLETMKASKK